MERYSALKYKVHLSPHPVEKTFPELFKDPAINKIKLADQVIRYIIFLYSKDTGLVHEHPSDLQARKDQAAIDAGFERVGGRWPRDIQEVMDMQNQDAHNFIMAFLRKQKHNVWTEICVTEQELFEFQSLRFATIGGKETNANGKKKSKTAEEDKDILVAAEKKEKLLKACNDRIKHLEILYEQFYGDNKDVQVAEFDEMITPEKAERILEGQKPYEEETVV